MGNRERNETCQGSIEANHQALGVVGPPGVPQLHVVADQLTPLQPRLAPCTPAAQQSMAQ